MRAIGALSPEHVLERGFALVFGQAGDTIRSPRDVDPGDDIQIRLPGGTVAAVVVAQTQRGQVEEKGG